MGDEVQKKEGMKKGWAEGTATLFSDYLKHINTLSTGSVVLMVTLLGIFPQPKAGFFLLGSFVSFTLSILVAVIAMLVNLVVLHKEQRGAGGSWFGPFFFAGMTFGCFFGGVLSLAVFAVANLDVLP